MAQRPVYIHKVTPPYLTAFPAEFTYNSGFAPSQKKKNITAIHKVFGERYPELRVLEISSKSMQDGGVDASAFNMKLYVPSLGRSLPVENIYQSSKVFSNGGPFPELLDVTPREAKRAECLCSSGKLTGYRYEGFDFPLIPQTVFYDYLYINALLENEDIAKKLLEYDAFTDIEFNPNRSVNCQAKAAAVFVALSKLGKLDRVKDPAQFIELFTAKPVFTEAVKPAPTEPAKKEEVPEAPQITVGDTVIHKLWGSGKVIEVNGTIVKIHFDSVGDKLLGAEWIINNCTVTH